MWKEFIKYIGWATIQHTIVIAPLMFGPFTNFERVLIGVPVFSFVGHYTNDLLIALTFLLTVVFYPLFFMLDFKVAIAVGLILVHATVGTYLKIKDYEMRVWRFKDD